MDLTVRESLAAASAERQTELARDSSAERRMCGAGYHDEMGEGSIPSPGVMGTHEPPEQHAIGHACALRSHRTVTGLSVVISFLLRTGLRRRASDRLRKSP